MFGFGAKLPVDEEARQWVDEGFVRLSRILGHRRLLECKVVLPTDEFFPDPFRGTPECAQRMLQRICTYMQIPVTAVEFHIYPDETEVLREVMPYWRGDGTKDASGVYFHDQDQVPSRVVGVKGSNLKDPLTLVATIAHELGHVILLGNNLLDREAPDMEPLTDLLTVFLGFGIFNGNAAAQFKKFQDERKQGWSMRRLGYLPQQVFGYALARFATERGERHPAWKSHLSTNLRSDFTQSLDWIGKNQKRLVAGQ